MMDLIGLEPDYSSSRGVGERENLFAEAKY